MEIFKLWYMLYVCMYYVLLVFRFVHKIKSYRTFDNFAQLLIITSELHEHVQLLEKATKSSIE